MRVSIVVPAFNEEKLLGATLDCLRAATVAIPECAWELIVCDNNSSDRTADIAREHGATVVFEPQNQISRARNAGAGHASGDWLLFVDADSSVNASLLREMLGEIRSGTCMAGGATITVEDAGPFVRGWTHLWNAASRLNRLAAGSFIFCEAAAFHEAGGFSTDVYAGEEIYFFRALKRLARARGRRIVILHRHPLVTSGRKAKLYSGWDMARFMVHTTLTGGRNLRKRDDCYAWYDGRR